MAAVEILREAAARGRSADGSRLASAQAFELALDPPARGLVIGVSHEGGDGARRTRALRAARAAGARTAVITVSAGSPAGGAGRRSSSRPASSTTAGATRSATSARWSPPPRSAPTCPAGRSTPPRVARPARRRARATRPARSGSPRRLADAAHLLVDRVRGGPAGRPRARAQGRGGGLAAVRHTATSRHSCTATCRRPSRDTGLVLILTDRDRRAGAARRARARPWRRPGSSACGRRRSWRRAWIRSSTRS